MVTDRKMYVPEINLFKTYIKDNLIININGNSNKSNTYSLWRRSS